MKEQAINIAIAKECGWKHDPNDPCERDSTRLKGFGGGWYHPDIPGIHPSPPYYTEDLNAMHEAEKTLSPESCAYEEFKPGSRALYIEDLSGIVDGCGEFYGYNYEGSVEAIYCLLHATARQRAEAFLRTIGKWKEDKE